MARLRYLRDRWAKRLMAESSRVRVLTPLEGKQAGGLALFNVDGIDTAKLQGWLWTKHRIITTPIIHAELHGLRITPNVYTTLDEVDRFSETVLSAVARGMTA